MDKILIVDFDKVNRMHLIDILSDKYEIVAADNKEEAVCAIIDQYKSLSAIILDMHSAVNEGFEVLRQKRNNILFSHIPAIIIMADDNNENKIRAFSLGASEYIVKPFSTETIINSLKNNIDKYKNTSVVRMMQFDDLTGMYNREAFFKLAANMINESEQGYYSLSCFDIESFKVINDQYGTETGDMILRHVADCIKQCVEKKGGICCRITNDNFAFLYPTSLINLIKIEDINKKASVLPCLNKIIKIRTGIYHINNNDISVSTMYDRAVMASETLKGRYDAPRIIEYNESMRSNVVHEQKIVNDMYDALKHEQFEPWFQPQYNHATGAMIGAEALVRWKKDDTYISPAEFVPVFEKNGFIYEMDQYMWESVCKLLRRWIDEGRSPLPVSVNISRRDLFHKHCVDILDGLVKKYSLPYNLLRLEVTESAFSESSKMIISKVVELIKLGFTVEIDDFGSGYSSLNTLKDVPASILKLDMKFFDNTENSQRGGNIIESVIRMAKWLGMAVIAEGVEHVEQADFLKSIGCYYIQGYYYSKPVPVSMYEELFNSCQKEHEMARLKTLATLNNNEFWNPKSMETLIFNSYVGGACIFEYHNGVTELLRVNDQYSQEFGYFKPKGKALLDNNIELYLDKENKDKVLKNINNAISMQKESFCILTLSDKENHTEYIRSTVRVIAQAGESYLLYCVIVNISEQIKADQMRLEAEKRESESAQQLEMIMENINGGVSAILVDDDGNSKFVFNNDNYYDLYGYTREEVAAEKIDIMKLIVPDDFNRVIDTIKKLKQDRKPVLIDYRCKKRNGEIAYLRANSSLITIEGYGSDVIASVISDITQEKSTIEKLVLLNNNIPGGLAKFEVKGDLIKIQYLSEGVFRLTGYTYEELLRLSGGDALFLADEEDREMLIDTLHTMLRTGKNMDCDFRAKLKNGELRWVNIRCSIGEISDDSVIINVVFLDVMDQKRAEDKLIQSQREISLQYEHEQQIRNELLTNSILSYTINLTKNIIEEYNSKIDFMFGSGYMLPVTKTLGTLIIENIVAEDRQKVINTLFSKNLLKSYNQSKTKILAEYRRIINESESRWIKTSATIVKRPDTNDIIAFLYSTDIDIEKKSQLAVESVINKEIDAISLINVKSGLQRVVTSKNELRMVEKGVTFDHDEMVYKKLNACVGNKESDLHFEDMLMKNLTAKLDSDGEFMMTYKIPGHDKKVHYKRTNAYYLDDTHQDIVFSEHDITDTLL